MTRQEALDNITKLNQLLDSMTDEELYEHMMATSPSFRKTVKSLDDIPEESDVIPHPQNWHPAFQASYYPGPRGHETIMQLEDLE